MANCNPGFMKLFDELLVNVADNRQKYKNTTQVKVNIDRETGEISVWNNGRPVQVYYEEELKIWSPELIFGRLRTGSNYDDAKRTEAGTTTGEVGGTNGIGAKATNIFALLFKIEICDAEHGVLYTQTWRKNMFKVEAPKIEKIPTTRKSYTKITYIPDLEKFGMSLPLDLTHYQLMRTRVWDLAGTCHLGVVSTSSDPLGPPDGMGKRRKRKKRKVRKVKRKKRKVRRKVGKRRKRKKRKVRKVKRKKRKVRRKVGKKRNSEPHWGIRGERVVQRL